MSGRPNHLLDAAIAAGIVPVSASERVKPQRPWPMTLFTTLGSWLAAAPVLWLTLIIVLDLPRGSFYVSGMVLLAGSLALMRIPHLPLLAEQMTSPILLTGIGMIGFGTFWDFHLSGAAAVMAVTAIAVSWICPQDRLRIMLGFSAGAMMTYAIFDTLHGPERMRMLIALHVTAFAWGIADGCNRSVVRSPVLDRLTLGWSISALMGLSYWAGMTMLVGANFDYRPQDAFDPLPEPDTSIIRLVSLTAAATGAAWLAFRWRSLRKTWFALAAAVLSLMAALMPTLGATLFILALSSGARRWVAAAAAGVAAAWIIGASYYQLEYSLAAKALAMAGAAAVFALIAWIAPDGKLATFRPHGHCMDEDRRGARVGIALAAAAILCVANTGIVRNETIIAHGQRVFIALTPLDPRSLLQGDYMALRFQTPEIDVPATRVQAVAILYMGDVAQLVRVHEGELLGPHEMLIDLTLGRRGWMVATDAWHFEEGQASRFQYARYGEFRVTSSGKALLVGMRGPNLEPL